MKPAILALLLLCSSLSAADVHEIKVASVGSLCVIEEKVPVTFVVASPARWKLWQPTDTAAAIETSAPGEVVVHGYYAAEAGQRPRIGQWIITIGQGGPEPGPGPGPTPPVPPSPIPNAIGVGQLAYDQAKAVNEPETALVMWRIWGWATEAMKTADTYDAQQAVFRDKIQAMCDQACSAKWDTFRDALEARFAELQKARVIKPGDKATLIAAMAEVTAALKILVGK